eukprot:5759445-Pyramimonas_sp.AAC.1
MPDCGKSSNSAATIRPKDSSGRTDLLGSLNVKSGTLSFNDAGEIQIVKSGIGQPSCPSQCRPPKLKDPWSWDMRRAALIRRRSETSINTNKCIPNERLYRRQTWWDRMVEVETKLTTISSQEAQSASVRHLKLENQNERLKHVADSKCVALLLSFPRLPPHACPKNVSNQAHTWMLLLCW